MKRAKATCDECYFRRAGLCAIPGNAPCPTYRAAGGTLSPPPQPRLVPRPAAGIAVAHAAA